jgi:predicted HTH transcriptional regulator
LIAAKTPESKTLDFKRRLTEEKGEDASKPGGIGEQALIAFAGDVSALANTDGGVLIIGIDEVNGTSARADGLPTSTMDKMILALEQSLREE